ncbi:MAG: hypothetical protein Q4G10_01100 [Bacteroidia bacterium]|nr:hypothetical protein [Bacteroidia bacterium]
MNNLIGRICSALCFLFVTVIAGAQQLDSLKYILPEFSQGTVIFGDKHISQGLLNISPLDQAVYCITSDKDTLSVAGNDDIISVSTSGRTFARWKDSFVELLTSDGDTGVGIVRSTAKVSNVKTGAYGMTTSTSSVKNYGVNTDTGNLTNLIIDDPRNFVYSKSPCLFKAGKYYPVSKKSFEKLFPGQKDFIESVWSERNINITDMSDVIAFYNELLQK